jgi:hypothetical protein
MKLVDLVLGWLEQKGFKEPPIRVEYHRVSKHQLAAERYHARTGEEIWEPIIMELAPYNAKTFN